MPRCGDKTVCHSKVINKTLQHVNDFENKKKHSKTQKFIGKMQEKIVEAI